MSELAHLSYHSRKQTEDILQRRRGNETTPACPLTRADVGMMRHVTQSPATPLTFGHRSAIVAAPISAASAAQVPTPHHGRLALATLTSGEPLNPGRRSGFRQELSERGDYVSDYVSSCIILSCCRMPWPAQEFKCSCIFSLTACFVLDRMDIVYIHLSIFLH